MSLTIKFRGTVHTRLVFVDRADFLISVSPAKVFERERRHLNVTNVIDNNFGLGIEPLSLGNESLSTSLSHEAVDPTRHLNRFHV